MPTALVNGRSFVPGTKIGALWRGRYQSATIKEKALAEQRTYPGEYKTNWGTTRPSFYPASKIVIECDIPRPRKRKRPSGGRKSQPTASRGAVSCRGRDFHRRGDGAPTTNAADLAPPAPARAPRPARGATKRISYAEPSVKCKVRKGHVWFSANNSDLRPPAPAPAVLRLLINGG